jgi:hypothetical protein
LRGKNGIDHPGIQWFNQRPPRFQRVRIKPPGPQFSGRKQIEDEPGPIIAVAERNQSQTSCRIELGYIKGVQFAPGLVEVTLGQFGFPGGHRPQDQSPPVTPARPSI